MNQPNPHVHLHHGIEPARTVPVRETEAGGRIYDIFEMIRQTPSIAKSMPWLIEKMDKAQNAMETFDSAQEFFDDVESTAKRGWKSRWALYKRDPKLFYYPLIIVLGIPAILAILTSPIWFF